MSDIIPPLPPGGADRPPRVGVPGQRVAPGARRPAGPEGAHGHHAPEDVVSLSDQERSSGSPPPRPASSRSSNVIVYVVVGALLLLALLWGLRLL